MIRACILLVFTMLSYAMAQDSAQPFAHATKTYATELNELHRNYYVVIAPDGDAIYWGRRGTDRLDIMTATRETDSTWRYPRPVGPPLNNLSNNVVTGVSTNGDTLYLYGKYRSDDSSEDGAISFSVRTGDHWSAPKHLITHNESNIAGHREETVTTDGGVVISSRQTDPTRQDRDIYISFRSMDCSYSDPVVVETGLNTLFDEVTPSIANDGKTLYFSSNRPGFGSHDVWVSKRLDETWMNWTSPQNLGPAINSDEDDVYFCLHPSNRYAYLYTYVEGRGGIYRVRIPQNEATLQLLPEQLR